MSPEITFRVQDQAGNEALHVATVEVSQLTPVAGRLYSPSSPFNIPIPADATVDPGSSTMISTMLGRGNGTTVVTWKAWSVPLYFADSSTLRYTVQFDRFHFGGKDFLTNVPIPDGALEDPGSSSGTDGHMTVIDTDSGCLYDLFEAHKEGSTWFAGWANRLDADSDATRALNYNVLNSVLGQRAVTYDIKNLVAGQRAVTYDVAGKVAAERALLYNILNTVAADRALTYDLLNAVSSNRALAYNIIAVVAATRALTYDINSGEPPPSGEYVGVMALTHVGQ